MKTFFVSSDPVGESSQLSCRLSVRLSDWWPPSSVILFDRSTQLVTGNLQRYHIRGLGRNTHLFAERETPQRSLNEGNSLKFKSVYTAPHPNPTCNSVSLDQWPDSQPPLCTAQYSLIPVASRFMFPILAVRSHQRRRSNHVRA